MTRKKKKESSPLPARQARLFAPEPVPPVAPREAEAALPPDPVRTPEAPDFLQKLCEDAIRWAEACGLQPPLGLSAPERIDYPRTGHGYLVTIQEETGKRRLGSARFNARGEPTYWSLDGILSG